MQMSDIVKAMARITDLSDTKSCLYTDYLLCAMITVTVVITWAIFKWFAKKLLATALRNWRPQPVLGETNKLSANEVQCMCPTNEIDCTTVAVQETSAHDTNDETKDKNNYYASY